MRYIFLISYHIIKSKPMVIYTTLAATAREYYDRFKEMMLPGRIGIYVGCSDKSHEAEVNRKHAFHEFGADQIRLVVATRKHLIWFIVQIFHFLSVNSINKI